MARVPWKDARPGDRERRAALDELYAELPKIECAGLCYESCGPIFMSRVEWQRMVQAGGERKAVDLECPYLEKSRCSVYAVRPMICRLWGIAEGMPCIFGCVPERMLSRAEANDFLDRAAAISE